MKKILITGANGYLGAFLSKRFSESGFEVTGVFYPQKPDNKTFLLYFTNYYVGDLSKPEFIDEITDIDYDILIHLVSLDHNKSNGKPDFISRVNVQPLWNLLEQFSKKNNLLKSIYFSTIHVYGNHQTDIDEHTIPNPRNKYALTHLLAEQINTYYDITSDIECINVRLSNSYGPPIFADANCWWLVVNDLCKTAIEKGKIILQSEGLAQRDFIFREDVFRALHKLCNDHQGFKTFNISSGRTYFIYELAQEVQSCYQLAYGMRVEIFTPSGKLSENKTIVDAQRFYVKNINLSRIGYGAKYTLQDGILELFKYFDNGKV